MKMLGIETSCDETAVAIVDEHKTIHANLVLSQIKEHRAFGGVVPEIAARAHINHLDTLIRAAMDDANLTFDDLGGIAATCGPGLIGGVMIGMMAGKSIAAARNIPFIAINHLEGHALTPRLTDDIEFPYLLLLASGGHTQILVAEDVGRYKRWGTTLDDAAGECFDKSAKIMGLPYPGGPELEKIALECKDPEAALKRFPLPHPLLKKQGKDRKELDFSFSGLKTAMRTHVEKLPEGELNRQDVADLACAFQITMAEILAERCQRAIDKFKNEYHPPPQKEEDKEREQNHPPAPIISDNAPAPNASSEVSCGSSANAPTPSASDGVSSGASGERPTNAPAPSISSEVSDKPSTSTPTLVVSGGVSANTTIRSHLLELCKINNCRFYAPPLELCGDNAAMIAWAGLERIQKGVTPPKGDPFDFKAKPRWPLDPEAPARHGAGVKA